MPGSTTIIDWLGYGDLADIPNAATLDALIAPGTFAFYFAGDTGDVYALDRTSPGWVLVATSGATGITQLTGDVTAGPGSGSQAATIANDAVTAIKIADDAVETDKIIDAAVTNAKLANMPALSFKANLTGSTAAPDDAGIADVADALAPYMPAGAFVATQTKTSNYAIVVGDVGTHFNNIGASGAVEFDLPAASDGLWFGFLVWEPEYLQINADGYDTISIGDETSLDSGNIGSDVPFSFLILESHAAGSWVARSVVGNWEVDGTPIGAGGGITGPGSATAGNIAIFVDETEIDDSGIAASDVLLAISGKRTPYDRGTISTGTETPEPSEGAVQIAANGGAHTLAPPTETGSYVLTYQNGGSAGAVTAGAWDRVDDPDAALTHTVEDSIIECAAYNDGLASRLIVTLIVDAT